MLLTVSHSLYGKPQVYIAKVYIVILIAPHGMGPRTSGECLCSSPILKLDTLQLSLHMPVYQDKNAKKLKANDIINIFYPLHNAIFSDGRHSRKLTLY